MKALLIVFTCLLSHAVQGQELEVKQTIAFFFEGFHQRDTVKMQSVCSKNLRLQSILESKTKGNQLTDQTPAEFFNSIAKIPLEVRFEERLLSYSIQIDHSMATVWTPYEFYLNGQLSHSGVNVFTLYKEMDTWKIIYIIDTRRRL
jgi:hypothetical protein